MSVRTQRLDLGEHGVQDGVRYVAATALTFCPRELFDQERHPLTAPMHPFDDVARGFLVEQLDQPVGNLTSPPARDLQPARVVESPDFGEKPA